MDTELRREFDRLTAIASEHGDIAVARKLADGSLEVLPATITVDQDVILAITVGEDATLTMRLDHLTKAIENARRR